MAYLMQTVRNGNINVKQQAISLMSRTLETNSQSKIIWLEKCGCRLFLFIHQCLVFLSKKCTSCVIISLTKLLMKALLLISMSSCLSSHWIPLSSKFLVNFVSTMANNSHTITHNHTYKSFRSLGFGVQLDSLLKKEKVPFAVSFDYLQRLGALRFINPFLSLTETFGKIFTPWKMSTTDHIHQVDSFAEDVITKRRKEIANGIQGHKDLLSRFMNTVNENGEKLNDVELRDTVLNFIIAGRDTTAQALSWLFYNLALQPRVEKKIIEEIQDKISDDAEKDSPALYEIINNMPYLHAV